MLVPFLLRNVLFKRHIAGAWTASKQNIKLIMTTSAGELPNFTNETIEHLPVDPDETNVPRTVKDACFTRVSPTPVLSPALVAYSPSVLGLIDIHTERYEAGELAELLAGNRLLPGSAPHAHCYAGHQYGFFNGQLGDGANIYIGDVTNKNGEMWQLNLKGTGLTPYARAGTDGRKVLRSSVREYICSEAMHHLGIPTVRCGSLVVSDTMVTRDKFYDGRPEMERAAVVSRVASTLLRVGSLEICKSEDELTGRAGPSAGNISLLHQMLNFVIKYYYPQIHSCAGSTESRYLAFYQELVRRTATMVAEWQAVGFCHGVINTDNISLVGLSLDYGPFAFMESFNQNHLSNAADHWGEFTFRKQPEKCKWCLERLADVLPSTVPQAELKKTVNTFDDIYKSMYLKKMRQKLGLVNVEESDEALISDLLLTMENTGADYHKTFRALSNLNLDEGQDCMLNIFNCCAPVRSMRLQHEKKRCPTEGEIVRSLWALQTNPKLIPAAVERSHEAMKELNTSSTVLRILAWKDLSNEEKRKSDKCLWENWISAYTARLAREHAKEDGRGEMMRAHNPAFVPKNYILHKIIEDVEGGNFNTVQALALICESPYTDLSSVCQQSPDLLQTSVENIIHLYESGATSNDWGRKMT